MDIMEQIYITKNFLVEKGIVEAEIAVVLGSGLGEIAEKAENSIILEYKDVPGFPISTVQGHKGRFIYGDYAGKKCLFMQGRFHFYEGYEIETVVFPIRVMIALGIKKLIVTNSSGGVNLNFGVSEIMLIKDHINLCGINPLVGKNLDEFGPRFSDMSMPYSTKMIEMVSKKAIKENIKLEEGVYCWVTGPSYETPAEIRMMRTLGADAVGMSTVPEVIVARHAGVEVVGISCITNMASGILNQALDHKEVIENSEKAYNKFGRVIHLAVEEF